MLRRSYAVAGLALAAATLASSASAQSRNLTVEIDRTQRVQLNGAASSVVVGNPQIADVTVVDANTLFVIGKGYGVTEVVAVDAIGRTLFQGEIAVTAGSTGAVRVWRGGQATEMACGQTCAPSIRSQANGSGAQASPAP
ncbi:pilus assembly protein N-terminal domain-containing protein [Brevundimonas sp. PAMC22021]|uniref:pilus assembly protein N-terminal domain-containing protein n=1 Tax=Brevundimonas sp. PAMC22021 TaxID=2861285 RepID=UPI001C637E1B|nr:pilus assembly protein N-terminal domain-containing protein [Brevundimonas sp. PAMC22021]QYF86114.1 pilus assembly protein N-terminal domain-containing protein [Brevundimonas sp. PAMC22021]